MAERMEIEKDPSGDDEYTPGPWQSGKCICFLLKIEYKKLDRSHTYIVLRIDFETGDIRDETARFIWIKGDRWDIVLSQDNVFILSMKSSCWD
jgi:hypothetical protein